MSNLLNSLVELNFVALHSPSNKCLFDLAMKLARLCKVLPCWAELKICGSPLARWVSATCKIRSTTCLGELPFANIDPGSTTPVSQVFIGQVPWSLEGLGDSLMFEVFDRFITQTLHDSMGLAYIPISWGGLGGQCRHIWQSHGVSG